jgi:hypothetical protein
MRQSALKTLAIAMATSAALLAVSSAAQAGPIFVFSTSTGTQPSNVGTITVTQVDANHVSLNVDLLSGYGFVNSGGPHTPFAFNLNGGLTGLAISSWSTPVGGSYTNSQGNGGTFSLNTATGGDNTGFGHFNVALDDTAGNGSSQGYFGDLLFTLYRPAGLDTGDFTAFSADLSNNINSGVTGSQGWSEGVDPPSTDVPEPLTMSLFAAGLAGMAGLRRRKSLSGATVA